MRVVSIVPRLAAFLCCIVALGVPACDLDRWELVPPTPTLAPVLHDKAALGPPAATARPSPTATPAEAPRREAASVANAAELAAQPTPLPSPTRSPAREAPAAVAVTSDPNWVIQVARKVRPAVVSISTFQVSLDQLLRPVPEEAGIGSGVLFDRRGLILTNNHVVAGAERLRVSLPDGRSFEGRVVGADRRSDLAVVKIEGDNLPVAELGESDKLQVGEWVVAIGNALALEGGPTVTVGVVGALDRYITTPTGNVLFDLIQTDAAINPGNSGGPLLNLNGQVVGINTAIAQAPGAGIGFAIAIDRAKPVIADLVARGRVIRPWLGVQPVTVSPSLAAQYRLPATEGVLVVRVEPSGPAVLAGIRAGDVIVAVGEDSTRNVVGLLKALAKYQVGQSVKVTVVRQSGRQVFTVTLEEMRE